MPTTRRMRPSTIATIIAVAAILLGVVDSMQTRAHNRLSVKPWLVLDYSIAAQTGSTTWTVAVSNEGVGPGIIESMTIVLPPSLGGGEFTDWSEPVERLRARGAQVATYWNYEGGEALGVQRSRELIRVVLAGDAQGDLLAVLDEVDVRLAYESAYGEDFEVALRD